MLKRLEFIDFSQFIQAVKRAEGLDLRYTVERERQHYTHRPHVMKERKPLFDFTPIEWTEGEETPTSHVLYTLTILPDEADIQGEQLRPETSAQARSNMAENARKTPPAPCCTQEAPCTATSAP